MHHCQIVSYFTSFLMYSQLRLDCFHIFVPQWSTFVHLDEHFLQHLETLPKKMLSYHDQCTLTIINHKGYLFGIINKIVQA